MASPLNFIYPAKGRILLDGGLNTKYEKAIIQDQEATDCLNVIFSDGAAGTRPGAQKVNTAAIGSFVVDGIYSRRDNTNAETMVVFAGGSAWQLATTTFSTIGSAQSVFTAGVRVAGALAENHLFSGNGYVIPYKWNGTDWTRHGVYPPTATMTVASQAAGVLTGDYRYKLTNVNSALVESDVGPSTATFTGAGATLRVSVIPTAAQSFGVSTRKLYRTAAGGSTFKLVTTISDNTTTQYDDNIADGSLGANAPTDNGVPPKYNAIIYHQNRLFMNDLTNQNYVWYSELAQPYTVASSNFIRVGDNTTDLIKGFGTYDNAVVVFCEKSIWLIYMPTTDPTDWTQVKVRSAYGSSSHHGIVGMNNSLVFPALQNLKFVGFAQISGDAAQQDQTLLTVTAASSDLLSQRIEPDMFSVQGSYVKNISSVIFKNALYTTVTYGSGQTANNRIYVYDFSSDNLGKKNKGAWAPWTGLNAAQFCVYNGSLYYGTSTATGFIYKLDTTVYNDDGTAINSYLWTKEFSGLPGHENNHKDFRYITMLIDNAGAYFMNVSYLVDSEVGAGTNYQVDLDPGTSVWGTMVWGRDTWGGGSYQMEYQLFLANARGKRIKFKFSNQNTINQRFKVHGIKYSYNLKGVR